MSAAPRFASAIGGLPLLLLSCALLAGYRLAGAALLARVGARPLPVDRKVPAVALAAVNVFGGFLVTRRMLENGIEDNKLKIWLSFFSSKNFRAARWASIKSRA